MNNQQALVDQIVQNLAFEVEAVPKTKSFQATNISHNTPLNVKIKVKKKDEIQPHDFPSILDDTTRAGQKIRIVNNDRTIMTFDVFMEAEFDKKPPKKLRKLIFDMLKPGICLRALDDDEYPYIPSSSYTADITEPSVASKSDGTLQRTFTLSKNAYQDCGISTEPGSQKWLFGKCKPGGCLDPPFSEDKYSYKPSLYSASEPEREGVELLTGDLGSGVDDHKISITLQDNAAQSNERHSSNLDSGLFKNRKKRSNTKLPDKTDSIIDIYQGELATNSISAHSNSIITYPPQIRSDPRISNNTPVRSSGPSEDKSRKSFNDHSEPYFVRPKGVKRIKEKDKDSSNYQNHQSSDATDIKISPIESFKILTPPPISIPIPMMSNHHKPEVTSTNDDILKTLGDNGDITKLDYTPDTKSQNQDLQDTINFEDTNIPPQLIRDKSVTRETVEIPVGSSKHTTSAPFKVEQAITLTKIEDQNLDKTNLQQLNQIDSKHNIDDTVQPKKISKTEPLTIPILNPVPFIDSNPNLVTILDSKMINKNLGTNNTELNQSNQPFETKITPPFIIDTLFENSEHVQQNNEMMMSSGENEAQNATLNLQNSDEEADAVTENDIRSSSSFAYQKSDNGSPENIAQVTKKQLNGDIEIEEIIKEIRKSLSQNDIKNEDNTAYKHIEESSENVVEITDLVTPQIKDIPNKEERKYANRISLSKLPTLKKSMSLLNENKTSAVSIKDKTNRDSPDVHLYDVRLRDTDLNVYEDDKRTPLSSELQYEIDTVIDKTSELQTDKENVRETTTPTNSDVIDFYTESQTKPVNQESITNDKAAPIIMHNTERTSSFRQHDKVYSETKLLIESIKSDRESDPSLVPFTTQMASRLSSSYAEDDIHSTVIHELIENKYSGTDEFICLTSPKEDTEKNPSSDIRVLDEDTVLPYIQPTSTLKNAIKKDTVSVNLGFHSYLNDQNERTVRTFDAANAPIRLPKDLVTVLETQIRISSYEIKIPVDSEHDMSIKIKKANANQRVSISDSEFVNVIDNGRVNKQISSVKNSDTAKRSSEAKIEEKKKNILETQVPYDNFVDCYERELVPLQLIIRNLREEIDVLAAQQSMLKDKLFCQNKSKLPRLVHSNKKCFGCVRK